MSEENTIFVQETDDRDVVDLHDVDIEPVMLLEEVLRIEKHHEAEKRRKAELQVFKEQRKVLQTQQALLTMQLELLETRIVATQQAHGTERETYHAWYAELLQKYGVNDGQTLGYNPDTLVYTVAESRRQTP